jgi:hypothetical protein
MNRCSGSQEHAALEQNETAHGRSPSGTQAVNDKLIKAVRIALRSESAQRDSPAWAVLNIYYETALYEDDDKRWAARLLRMGPGDYSIKWDISLDAWSSNGTIEFSGHEIAQQCARWVENGWDFNTHDADDDPCAHEAEGAQYEWKESEPLIDQEEGDEEFFLLPLQGEVLRRVWAQERAGSTVLRYLDIRRADHCDLYEYVVQEEGNPAVIACSGGLLERSMLKLLVRAEAIPVTASAPYFIEAGRWLDEANKAALEQQQLVRQATFRAAS